MGPRPTRAASRGVTCGGGAAAHGHGEVGGHDSEGTRALERTEQRQAEADAGGAGRAEAILARGLVEKARAVLSRLE